jgi:hypothetical protein
MLRFQSTDTWYDMSKKKQRRRPSEGLKKKFIASDREDFPTRIQSYFGGSASIREEVSPLPKNAFGRSGLLCILTHCGFSTGSYGGNQ